MKPLDQPIYIVDGIRTPFGKMGTAFADTDAVELGRTAVAELLARTGLDPAVIEEVVFGCVAQPADAANIARVIALRAGIPDTVSAVTVHRNCASGFESVTQAAEKMMVGRGDVFVVGGTENMSLVPLLYSATAAKKFGALARAKTLKDKIAVAASFRPEDFKPRIGLQMGFVRSGQWTQHGSDRRECRARLQHHARGAGSFLDGVAPQGGRSEG